MLNSWSSGAAQSLVHQLSVDRLLLATSWCQFAATMSSCRPPHTCSSRPPHSSCPRHRASVQRRLQQSSAAASLIITARLKASQNVFLNAATKARFISFVILHWTARPFWSLWDLRYKDGVYQVQNHVFPKHVIAFWLDYWRCDQKSNFFRQFRPLFIYKHAGRNGSREKHQNCRNMKSQ